MMSLKPRGSTPNKAGGSGAGANGTATTSMVVVNGKGPALGLVTTSAASANGTITAPPAPALVRATRASTLSWQNDLEDLFDHAKERFPDVVWTLMPEPTGKDTGEEVWGHKAMVYARAPPSFQQRYFSFRPAPIASPLPYSSPHEAHPSSVSLISLQPQTTSQHGHSQHNHSSQHDHHSSRPSSPRTPSPFRGPSPTPSQVPGTIMRLTTTISPALFAHEVEYLYTGKGMGAAFEFLFDSGDGETGEDKEEMRVDKLRKDLVYMWRARLYSDVRLALTGYVPSASAPSASIPGNESTMPVFSSHRFILVSRSPYFRSRLLSAFAPPQAANYGSPITLDLPGTAFTPASLHFTLGYLYTGTLSFSHRTYDLSTAFAIYRSSLYLQLETLSSEVEARIVEEMCHGLFRAFESFEEYEKLTGGKWGIGGCRCRQCQRRAPRVLDFAMREDVSNKVMERGARRALVGMFGEGWTTGEFAGLPNKVRLGLIKGVVNRTTPQNIFNLLWAAHAALRKVESATGTTTGGGAIGKDDSAIAISPAKANDSITRNTADGWMETVREMVLKVRTRIDDVMCNQCVDCFEQREWIELLEEDGGRFSDTEKVGWVMDSVRRGLADTNAGNVYQTIVSSIILRPHPVEVDQTLLPTNSGIRQLVEECRVDVIVWLRKHWIQVRLVGGFDGLDGWALKELSHELDVPLDQLFTASPLPPSKPSMRHQESNTGSMHATMLTRTVKKGTPSITSSIKSGIGASIKSGVTRSTRVSLAPSTTSTATGYVAGGGRTRGAGTNPPKSPAPGPSRSTAASPVPSKTGLGRMPGLITSPAPSQGGYLASASSSIAETPITGGMYTVSPSEGGDDETESPSTPRLLSGNFGRSGTYSTTASGPSAENGDDGEVADVVFPGKDGDAVKSTPPKSVTARKDYSTSTPLRTGTKSTASVKSSAASVKSSAASVKSQASTVRTLASKTPAVKKAGLSAESSPVSSKSDLESTTGKSTLAPPGSNVGGSSPRGRTSSAGSSTANRARTSSVNRPTASSTTRANLNTPRTPTTPGPRSASTTPSSGPNRKISAGSGKVTPTPSAPKPLRPRRSSVASTTSVGSSVGGGGGTGTRPKRPSAGAQQLPAMPGSDRVPPIKRPPSAASVRSATSATFSAADRRRQAEEDKVPEVPKKPKVVVLTKGKGKGKAGDKTTPPTITTTTPTSTRPAKVVPTQPPTSGPEDEGMDSDDDKPLPPPKSPYTGSPTKVTRVDPQHQKHDSGDTSTIGRSDGGTLKARLGRRGSTDTITGAGSVAGSVVGSESTTSSTISTTSTLRPTPNTQPVQPPPRPPPVHHAPTTQQSRGITLNVGIPCIISSKRARFRAFARYIGEVAGEAGSWVGVEVPVGESWSGDKLEGRDWNDGTWGGVRYFEIGMGPEWEDHDQRAARRRRLDWVTSGVESSRGAGGQLTGGLGLSSKKRDYPGEWMVDGGNSGVGQRKRFRSASPAVSDMSSTEARGLFVRPSQVLYVVDAVGGE